MKIYVLLLLFSPEASLVRQQFWNQRVPALSYVEGIKPEWDVYLWTLVVPDRIRRLTYSPNGRFLASADDGVRLWNASTGTHVTTLEDKKLTNRTTQIQFLSNSQLFASIGGKEVSVWDISTWTKMSTTRVCTRRHFYTLKLLVARRKLCCHPTIRFWHRSISAKFVFGPCQLALPRESSMATETSPI